MRTVRDVSAGGVVYRLREGQLEVAVVGKISPKRWSLPKGGQHRGESLEQAALREVREETGLQARLISPLGAIDYWFRLGGRRHFKTVHFYLMEATGGDVSQHDHEYDVVEWFTVDRARQEMTYTSEIDMVERAVQAIESLSSTPDRAPFAAPTPPGSPLQ
jgi:8-oxo-dGTP pyrophosphatase MutT (NUDIX family)